MLTHISGVFYRTNKVLRDSSRTVVGTFFEPERDVVVITGGCGGLGHELAGEFAARSAKVIVLDLVRPSEAIDGVHYFQADVGDYEQVLYMRDTIERRFGTVTVLVNNAGITCGKPLVDLTVAEIENTLRVNLLSSFYTIKAFLPHMLEMQRGYVVTVASILGYLSPARLSAYGASKSGLIALHESLTYELGAPILQCPVKTLLVCPGQMKTAMFAGVNTPSTILAPELNPRDVAARIVAALECGRRGEMKLPFYGRLLPVVRAVPWPMVYWLRKMSGVDKSMSTFVQAKEMAFGSAKVPRTW